MKKTRSKKSRDTVPLKALDKAKLLSNEAGVGICGGCIYCSPGYGSFIGNTRDSYPGYGDLLPDEGDASL